MLALQTADPVPVVDELATVGLEAFPRRTVACGSSSADKVASYLRSATLSQRVHGPTGLRIADVARRHVEEYRRELVERAYTPLIISTKLIALRRLFAAAVDAGVLASNPAEGAARPSTGAKREPPSAL